MRSVSDFTRSRTSSCVSVLGVTLQPATTATTANITRLRGRKPVARRETEGVLFIFMFSKNWCSAFDRCGSCDGARAVQSVLGHALHLGAEALGRAGQLNRLFLHRRFVTSLHGLRRSFAFATDGRLLWTCWLWLCFRHRRDGAVRLGCALRERVQQASIPCCGRVVGVDDGISQTRFHLRRPHGVLNKQALLRDDRLVSNRMLHVQRWCDHLHLTRAGFLDEALLIDPG